MNVRSIAPIIFFAAIACRDCRDEAPSDKTTAPAIARCVERTGDVRSHPARELIWVPIDRGGALAAGDWLRTGKSATAKIAFLAGETLAVSEDSTVVVHAPSDESETREFAGRIVVVGGVVRGALSGSGAERRVILESKDGQQLRVAAVAADGFDYRVTATEDGRLEVAVTRGAAEVIAADGSKRTLSAGDVGDVLRGRFEGTTERLPGFPSPMAPGVDATVAFRADLEVRMAWSSVEGAANYLVRVSSDPSFSTLVASADTAASEWIFRPRATGTFFWRVAARSARGRLGEYGYARRLVVTEDRSVDLLVGPMDGLVVESDQRNPVLVFSWQAVEPPAPYALIVARDAELADVVLRVETKEQNARTEKLGAGSYRWGVFAVRDGAHEPIFRAPRTLTIRAKTSAIRAPRKLEWK